MFLSTAAAYNHPQLSVLYRWFHGNLWLVTPESDRNEREWFTSRRLLTDDRDRVLELLRVADLGIDDIEVVKQDPDPPRVRLIRSSGRRQTAFDFDDESYGTRNWFALLGPLLLTLKEGAVLLVDELDASLHTALVAEFIRLFQDPKANPNCAQLIFTSHDTTPLGTATGNRPLGREQVWLTEKRTDGATELYPLTDAHPRKDENLERGYRAGRYGGVPQVGPGTHATVSGRCVVLPGPTADGVCSTCSSRARLPRRPTLSGSTTTSAVSGDSTGTHICDLGGAGEWPRLMAKWSCTGRCSSFGRRWSTMSWSMSWSTLPSRAMARLSGTPRRTTPLQSQSCAVAPNRGRSTTWRLRDGRDHQVGGGVAGAAHA